MFPKHMKAPFAPSPGTCPSYCMCKNIQYDVVDADSYLSSLSVLPVHPVAAITAVLDPVMLGKLVTHSISVATLGAHQRDEVQRTQVHLEVLLEPVRL